jgi:beta-galactosidase
VLKPDVTSYDYDAPLSEAGDITPKYHAFRKVIARRTKDPVRAAALARPLPDFSTPITKQALGKVPVSQHVSLDSVLGLIGTGRTGRRPYTMEEMAQGYGYMLYRVVRRGPGKAERVVLWQCNDRAVVAVNQRVVHTQTGNEVGQPFTLEFPLARNVIDVLVENQGRVNFGEKMDSQRKGIQGAIIFDKHAHCEVESWGLPLDKLSDIDWNAAYQAGGMSFHRATFRAPPRDGVWRDSFLRLDAWGKGIAVLNGHNLGRYWDLGPQRTLYMPGPWIRDGENELIIFESEGRVGESVEITDRPDLG